MTVRFLLTSPRAVLHSSGSELLLSAHFNTNQQRKRARNADNQRRFYASVPERSVNTANSNTVLNTVNSNTVFNTTIPLSDKQQRTMKSVYQVCMRFLMEKMALSH
jgi:hypothetical protein